jgi:hypothetical protein
MRAGCPSTTAAAQGVLVASNDYRPSNMCDIRPAAIFQILNCLGKVPVYVLYTVQVEGLEPEKPGTGQDQ